MPVRAQLIVENLVDPNGPYAHSLEQMPEIAESTKCPREDLSFYICNYSVYRSTQVGTQ